MAPNNVLMQLLTAPFPQMMLSSIAILVISYILLTFTKIKDPKMRSFFYSLTLVAPVVVYLFYTPTIWVMRPNLERGLFEGTSFVISQVGSAVGEGVTSIMVASPAFATIVRGQEAVDLSYTGLLCIIGLVFGIAILAVSYFFGVRIVKRCQGVMDVTAEDEPRLYKSVEKLASRVGVATPKIGLTENLQPNAFTIGYGDSAMVVFSSGLISTLNQVELEAVIAHELAHIKNRDFHLMAMVSSLKIVSFFNPAAYLSASLLAREREYLADDIGSKATGRKNTLKRALIKIAAAPVQRRAVVPELVSGLFIYSQIGSLRAAFTSHPSLDMRLDRIGRGKSGDKMDGYKAALVAVLLVGSLVMLSSYIMQPMHLVDMFFGFGPGFRAPIGGVMFSPFRGGGGMQSFTFSTSPFGFRIH
jgi:Zn-dependent protease with chaperone function